VSQPTNSTTNSPAPAAAADAASVENPQTDPQEVCPEKNEHYKILKIRFIYFDMIVNVLIFHFHQVG
jgi:hypothetical protein